MTTLRKLPITNANAKMTAVNNSGDWLSSSGIVWFRHVFEWPKTKRRSECPPNAADLQMTPDLLNHCTHLEDREVHGDDKTANEDTEDAHDQRLKQAREVVNGVVHVFLKEVRDLRRHFVQ